MTKRPETRRWWWRPFRLHRDKRGSVAAEFALLAFPLFMLIVGVVEIGVMLIQSVMLHGALEEGARKLRTGQVYQSASPWQEFTDTVCGEMLFMMSCDDLKYDVRHYHNYESLDLAPVPLGDDGMPSSPVFSPGDAGTITVARLYARYEFITPLIGHFFEDTHNSRLIQYTVVVKGEPWT